MQVILFYILHSERKSTFLIEGFCTKVDFSFPFLLILVKSLVLLERSLEVVRIDTGTGVMVLVLLLRNSSSSLFLLL